MQVLAQVSDAGPSWSFCFIIIITKCVCLADNSHEIPVLLSLKNEKNNQNVIRCSCDHFLFDQSKHCGPRLDAAACSI